METTQRLVQNFANDIKAQLTELVLHHSKIVRWNYPGSGTISLGGDYSREPLSIQGHQLQSKLLEDYHHFFDLLRVLIALQPSDVKKDFLDEEKVVVETIEQNGSTFLHTTEEALRKAHDALEKQVSLIDHLYDGSEGAHIFVPDTNALIFHPNLEEWDFPNVQKFKIVLTPTVLKELDGHKINHRNEEVRKKANSLIKRIKGYRTRGHLFDGVPLRSPKSTLMSIAKEPNFENTLPWLDSNNADDRYLASFIEVMRMFPRSSTILVTMDINLQNKAEFARVPFSEPPELILNGGIGS